MPRHKKVPPSSAQHKAAQEPTISEWVDTPAPAAPAPAKPTSQVEVAELSGRQARIAGLPISRNPYSQYSTELYLAWERGWNNAK